MASYNVQLQVANGASYDELYPMEVADIGTFDKGTTNMVATNLQSAIVELYLKGR